MSLLQVRMTRSSQLAGTQAEARDTVFLGREGKQFELRDLDCRYSEQRTFAKLHSARRRPVLKHCNN